MDDNLKYKISLEDLVSKGLDNADHHANRFEASMEQLTEKISGFRGAMLGAFVGFEAFEFGKGAAADFLNLEKATSRLQFTVGQRGGLASDFKDLTEQSEKLGKTSFFNHVEIQNAENQLLNFGISIKQTKSAMQALTDVGLAKGKGLDEVIGAASMAAAGGRAMALKEYGLGFIKLEKDMSVAGAEARNFNKIIKAMGKEFSGATDAMNNTEFFKIKKMQDEFEEFKESVGRNLLKVFDSMLPYIKQAIEYLKEFGHFLKEHAQTVKALAIALGVGAVAFKAFSEAEALAQLTTEGLTAALLANPIGLMAAGIAALTFGVVELAGAFNEAREAKERLEAHEQDVIGKEEGSQIQKRLEALKNWKDGEAKQNEAIVMEQERLMNIITIAQQKQNEFFKKGIFQDNAQLSEQTNVIDSYTKRLQYLKSANKSDLFKEIAKGEKGKAGQDLGSGLSEPKASKIQNVTINLNQPFQNQKINMGGGSLNPGEIATKFTEYLISLAEDTAIIATE